MHLCFIDESGSPPKPGKVGNRHYFVIAGLIMHEAQWHGICDEFKKLKNHADYKVRGEVKWRYFGPDNTDPDNSVAHLSVDARNSFRDALFDIIIKRKSVKIVACVTCCEAAYETSYVNSQDELYHYTYKPVSERFQYFLQDVGRTVGDKQLGIIIADHRGKKQDEGFRAEHHRLVDRENPFVSTYEHFVETIFLTPSHHSVGIQMVDMVAGAIGRAFNSNETRFADMLYGSFRARPNGDINGFGLVKFPQATWR